MDIRSFYIEVFVFKLTFFSDHCIFLKLRNLRSLKRNTYKSYINVEVYHHFSGL